MKEVANDGLPRLDLNRDQRVATVDDQVHLIPAVVPPEVDVWQLAAIVEILQQLANDEVFEDVTSHRMGAELLCGSNAQEEAQQSRVDEVEFGALDQAFVEVAVMGAKQEYRKACLQERKPAPGGVVADRTVVG